MENPFKKIFPKSSSFKKIVTPLFKVNLLIHKGEQPKLYIKLLQWLLSSGRYIVIIVELVTIGAFVFRYKLDSDLAELHEQIENKKPIIQSLKNDEITIRETQFQLKTIKQAKSDTTDFTAVLTKIAQLTPVNIKLTSISLDRTQNYPITSVIIAGKSPTTKELSVFLRVLQKDPAFADVILTNIAFEEQTNFTITGNLAEKGVKSS